MSESHAVANGHGARADSPNGVYPTEELDAVIVGAGFAGVYILVRMCPCICCLIDDVSLADSCVLRSINFVKPDSKLRSLKQAPV